MGFGRRNGRRDDRHYNPKKKIGLKKKIRLSGLVLAFVGLIILAINQNTNSQILLVSIALIIIGMVLISGKRIFDPPPCNCCMCKNCDRNHNHWTHERRN